MTEEFQSNMEELLQTVDTMKKFLISNSKTIKVTQYYLSLGNKNFLQVIEETLNDPLIDEAQKKEHKELLKTFLEKLKDFYFRLSLSNDPKLIEMKERMKEGTKVLGFVGTDEVGLFSELENTLKRLEKKEIAL